MMTWWCTPWEGGVNKVGHYNWRDKGDVTRIASNEHDNVDDLEKLLGNYYEIVVM